jgi:hypothetical protein
MMSATTGFDAVQRLYQQAYEDARQALVPPPQRELFRVMN